MIRNNKKHSTLILAGVSFLALTMATGTAKAGQTVSTPFPSGWSLNGDGPGATDYLVFTTGFSSGDDVVIDNDVTGLGNGTAITLEDGLIDGDLIIEDVYVVGQQSEFAGGNVDATAAGIVGGWENPGVEITGSVINDGFVGGYATAVSLEDQGADDDAEAYAFGGVFIGDQNTNFINKAGGTVYADAYASAYDTSLAVAGGLIQGDILNGTLAGATISNAGTIHAEATANAGKGGADGSDGPGEWDYDPSNTEARAWAVALGSGQLAGDVISGGASFTNLAGADVTVLAAASAIDYSEATAGALGIGGAQIGLGGASAKLEGTNDGLIDVEVDARAEVVNFTGPNDPDLDSALAMGAGVGFLQVGLGLGSAVADFANTYEVNVDVDALAITPIAEGYAAQAFGVGLGVGQVVGALGPAAAYIENYQTIEVDVYAAARGGLAGADAYGIGTVQAVGSLLAPASASLINTSPDSIDVYAAAYATGTYADANAYLFGAGQVAVSGFVATADLTNSGSILADGAAYADGQFSARADVDAAAVNQFVAAGFFAGARIDNSYDLEANAFAYATSASGDAYATASATGANQFGISTNVGLSITNQYDGWIDADATASAFAYSTADAAANAAGFVQNGSASNSLSLAAENYGLITVDAFAIASGAIGTSASYAYADAEALGSVQRGQGIPFADIYASLNNNGGSIDVEATAYAFAYQTAYADALAVGAVQELFSPAGDIYGLVSNDNGGIGALAYAYASSFYGEAYASAAAVGVGQEGEGQNVFLGTIRSGEIVAEAYATAITYDDLAYAEAGARGVSQEAFAIGRADVYTENNSLLQAWAEANATSLYGPAVAYATATGISQYAESLGGFASAAVNNSGLYGIVGFGEAEAFAKYSSADAEAYGVGINQYVDGFNRAVASVQNHANLYGVAFAQAESVYEGADATAFATGLRQDAYSANGTAIGYVDNSSLIEGYADATAFVYQDGGGADASAEAQGVFQEVDSFGVDPYGDAFADVRNDGTIRAAALAHAVTYYGTADADATSTGVDQEVYSEDGQAFAGVFNVGTIDGGRPIINAYAEAVAFSAGADIFGNGGFATASANATGIEQDADAYFGNAYTEVVSNGIISAGARASAISAFDDANASASATGIDQDPESEYGEASARVTNSFEILADARAFAQAYGSAQAEASATGIQQDSDAYLDVLADVYNTGLVSAYARAQSETYGYDQSLANAEVMGIQQDADSNFEDGFYSALATVHNKGAGSLITAYASALANAALYASALAYATATGIDQNPDSDGQGPATAEVFNEGQLLVNAFAEANNFEGYDLAFAGAYARGIEQDSDAEDGRGDVLVDNSRIISAVAKARANVFGDSSDVGANAYASASATGVDQDVDADDYHARGETTNTGRIEALADAIAFSAYDSAYADVEAMGVTQDIRSDDDGYSDAIVKNSSGAVISAVALGTASAWIYASASVSATGVNQFVLADDLDASAVVNNDGSIIASASARAIGTGTYYLGASTAFAEASATGIDQFVGSDDADATASVTNTSFLSIKANAYAQAIATDSARASAVVDGVDQEAFANDFARVETDNSGLISAVAYAAARITGDYATNAFAYATASGLDQDVGGYLGSTAFLSNSGELYGVAIAHADAADNSYAAARAKGHNASTDYDLNLDVTNYEDGAIWAFAGATAYDTANARAAGAWFEVLDYNSLYGTIVNAGFISGSAYATGSNGEAEAFGVVMISDASNSVTMTNTGVVSAIADGPTAYATAIAVASHYQESKGQGQGLTTINNDGGFIFAGLVGNQIAQAAVDLYGTTVFRGNAINTRGFSTFNGDRYGEAPNAVVFNWTGGTDTISKDLVEEFDLVSEEVQDALAGQNYGYVFGNGLLTDDEVINIKDGVTIFDGILNPDGGFYGELNIYNEGKLVLVQNEEEGAAGGYVENFNLASNGTLVMELTPYDEWEGFDYSQINAVNADVQGKFVALYTAGLYGNTMFYDNIINAENLLVADLVQGFSEVDDNSALIKTTAIVDNEGGDTNNIDLYAERIAFGAVAGMTDNQQAAGDAIEKVYGNVDLDTDFGRLVSQLFTLDDGDYQLFMDQLTGAEHAQHLRSVLWSTRAINRIITERMECDTGSAYKSASAASGAKVDGKTVMPTADAPMAATGCFEPGTASVWMRGFGQWNTLDGDENAPGGDETQYGIIFGGDYAFDENWFLGIAGGYFNSDGEFDDWGGRQGTDYDYDGLQLAAYGGFDNSTYYLRGVLSYGNYEGESHRMIAWPGGSPIDPSGDPSSNTFAFYGETGYRFDIGAGNITPFAGLNLATATLESFTEDDPDGTGAALEIHDSDANSIASVLGVRFDADMAMGSGIFTPTVSVAWMHEFADTPEVDMSFASAPSGADFTVVASEVARDSILVDAGAKFLLGDSVDFGVYYNGQFNEDYSSNAITARLGYKF